jgi:hypothetical protein
MKLPEKGTGRSSAFGYTALSVVAALLFLGLARWTGEAPPVAVWGGAVWVFVLSMIISMPLVTGWVRRRSAGTGGEGGGR